MLMGRGFPNPAIEGSHLSRPCWVLRGPDCSSLSKTTQQAHGMEGDRRLALHVSSGRM
jgi:hypothetical protein